MKFNKRKVFQVILGAGIVGSLLVSLAPVRSVIIAFGEAFIVHRALNRAAWHSHLLKFSYACFAICVFVRFYHRAVLIAGMAGSLLILFAPVRSAIITFGEMFIVHRALNHEIWHSHLLKLSYVSFTVCVFFRFYYQAAKVQIPLVLKKLRALINKLYPEDAGIRNSILNGMAFSGVYVLLSFIAVATKSAEFDATKTEVFIAFVLFGLAVAAVFVMIGFICKIIDAKKNLRVLSLFNKFCTALVLLFLIITVFWPETYGFIDGRDWEIDYSLLAVIKSLLPYCTALVIAVCVVLFYKKWFRYISPTLCILICVIFVLAPVVPLEKGESREMNFNFLSKNQNIIFIIWDGLPGIVAEYIFKQNPRLEENFRDFIFYSRAVSPYPQTFIAIPSIVGGIPTSQFDHYRKLQVFNYESASILKKSEASGYKNQIVQGRWEAWGVPGPYYDLRSIGEDTSLFARTTGIVYICSLRVLPRHIAAFVFDYNSELERKMRSGIPMGSLGDMRMGPVLMRNIDIGYEQPVFYAQHNMIPHGPHLVTPDGKFTNDATMLSGSEFSMNLMSLLLKRLKELGIYDNSLIVFCSDHGLPMDGGQRLDDMQRHADSIRKLKEFINWSPVYFSYRGKDNNSLWPVSMYNSLLLIKYPFIQQENLVVRDNPVTMLDLHQLFEQALNAPDWKAGVLTGVFDNMKGPIEVRLLRHEYRQDRYNFDLMPIFELENGLESLPELFDNLQPVSQSQYGVHTYSE